MKQIVEKRPPDGFIDYISLGLTTWGVGYLPIAPGTFGSMVAVAIYLGIERLLPTIESSVFHVAHNAASTIAWEQSAIAVALAVFVLIGIWASGRAIHLLGNSDPPQAVVDELIGQFITFLFVPFGLSWPLVLAGFLLFRIFDIWKPFPINDLQILPGGIGVCADDIIAGVYAGICLAVVYAVTLVL
jgi:phosphatidylglycerophosphatase A